MVKTCSPKTTAATPKPTVVKDKHDYSQDTAPKNVFSSKKSTLSLPKTTEEQPSTFKLLAVPMQKVSDEVMKYVTKNIHWRGLEWVSDKTFTNTKGVWGGRSRYQSVFDYIYKEYGLKFGRPHVKTKSIMLVYTLIKVEHDYYNNGFYNVDMDEPIDYDSSQGDWHGCPVVASEDDEFNYDYWRMLQFLYSVSPSVREVMMILKQRHDDE